MSVSIPTNDLERPENTAAARDVRRVERDDEKRNHERERQETASVAATSIAAVATAWSAFQAALWSGRQTFALARASKARELSTQARSEGDQQAALDANLFVAYSGAYATGN
ncbi:MAG: hypothetical protein ACXVEF_44995, partial [Polyangiales bacterium]